MKEKITITATELFLNLGFKSVTMDDIANEMGISKKTIYTHFNNKTALVTEVTSSLFCVISEGIDLICAAEKNSIEELYEIKRFVMEHLKNEKSSPQYQLQKYYPKIYATLKKKQFDVMQDCVKDNLNRGVNSGMYRNNIDVEFVARIYFTGVIGIKDNELFPAKMFPMHSLMDQFLEHHLRGICTPQGLETLQKFITTTNQSS
ncbi:TetR/AcrR family transcriptional regulator [Kordia sp.]|uniref:TetR/AcrR family transcriptional regulator n=1 Tax=Kordia sp. TaxID=1965332 RepID=UPI0025B8FE2C|nr:TetR/AcrR family transcriptional regulator [Kordia sp.]MCH2195873.1 TetR/AcrR family transcriptional regulator [Kordia sp.]